VHEHLPVGPGVVGRTGHGRKVLPPFRGLDVGAGQLPVGQADADLVDMLHQPRQVVVAHLVPEAAGAAVDHDDHLPRLDAQGGGRVAVEDLLDDLHLEEVIAGAQGAHLVLSPFEGALADRVRVGAGQAAPVLHRIQISGGTIAVFYGPAGPLGENLLFFAARQPQGPFRAHARGHMLEQGGDDLLHLRADLLRVEVGRHQATAAVDVVPQARVGQTADGWEARVIFDV